MRLYAAMEDELVVVDGGPSSPTLTRRLDGYELESVAASRTRPDRAFCGTFEGGLRRSTDGGEAWERVGAETLPDAVTAVAVSPHDPDEVWVGTEPSAVYYSEDGGETWHGTPDLTTLDSADGWSFPPRPSTHHVRCLDVDATDPDHLYVGIEAGALVQSHDGGETWEDRVPTARRDTHRLTTHPDAPNLAYVAAGDGFAMTIDGGETWTHPQSGLAHRYLWSVAAVDDDPETVFVSAAHGPRSAHRYGAAEAYVYRRRGDGDWERVGDGLPTGYGTLRHELAAGRGREVFALTNHGLVRTDDAGETWTRLSVRWPERFERQAPTGLVVV